MKALPNLRILGSAARHRLRLRLQLDPRARCWPRHRRARRGHHVLLEQHLPGGVRRRPRPTAAASSTSTTSASSTRCRAFPELICFRYNPGPRRTGNVIIGNPEEAKYGVTHEQLVEAYRLATASAAPSASACTRWSLPTSATTDYIVADRQHAPRAGRVGARPSSASASSSSTSAAASASPTGPSRPPLDLAALAPRPPASSRRFRARNGYAPRLFMESGRVITGPHGGLVTHGHQRKDTYRDYVGVDACMSSLMRPGMYDAYHHITVLGQGTDARPRGRATSSARCARTTTSSPCSASCRPIADGDLLVIHDTGAHGHAMGFQYNGRLRPKELLLRRDGIGRADPPRRDGPGPLRDADLHARRDGRLMSAPAPRVTAATAGRGARPVRAGLLRFLPVPGGQRRDRPQPGRGAADRPGRPRPAHLRLLRLLCGLPAAARGPARPPRAATGRRGAARLRRARGARVRDGGEPGGAGRRAGADRAGRFGRVHGGHQGLHALVPRSGCGRGSTDCTSRPAGAAR